MKISKFKELTKDLKDDMPVYVAHSNKEYVIANYLRESWSMYLYLEGTAMALLNNSSKIPTSCLSDFRKHDDDTVIEKDIEDGFCFRAIEDVLIFSDRIIII